ncbi:hypothetical protein quinque_005818 [Culex quinquefasciatus]
MVYFTYRAVSEYITARNNGTTINGNRTLDQIVDSFGSWETMCLVGVCILVILVFSILFAYSVAATVNTFFIIALVSLALALCYTAIQAYTTWSEGNVTSAKTWLGTSLMWILVLPLILLFAARFAMALFRRNSKEAIGSIKAACKSIRLSAVFFFIRSGLPAIYGDRFKRHGRAENCIGRKYVLKCSAGIRDAVVYVHLINLQEHVWMAMQLCLGKRIRKIDAYLQLANFKNAYIVRAISGKSFIASAKHAGKMLREDSLQDTDSIFQLLHLAPMCVLAPLGYAFFSWQQIGPTIVAAVGTYYIIATFLHPFEVVVKTAEFSKLIVREDNAGPSRDHP